MKKQLMAFLVATIITLSVGVGILLVGGAVYLNRNGTVVQNTAPAQVSASAANAQNQQVAQLQDLVTQYQDREKQYQDREQQYQQQLAAANQQIQADQQQFRQVQLLLSELQQRGIITVSNGRVFIN
jgi:DNA repair exonuclease SbcCD ATPase subunit